MISEKKRDIELIDLLKEQINFLKKEMDHKNSFINELLKKVSIKNTIQTKECNNNGDSSITDTSSSCLNDTGVQSRCSNHVLADINNEDINVKSTSYPSGNL